jgi:hypothetical protein
MREGRVGRRAGDLSFGALALLLLACSKPSPVTRCPAGSAWVGPVPYRFRGIESFLEVRSQADLSARLPFAFSLPSVEPHDALLWIDLEEHARVWRVEFADGFHLYSWIGDSSWSPSPSDRWSSHDVSADLPRALGPLATNPFGAFACAEPTKGPRVRGLLNGKGGTLRLCEANCLLVDADGTALLRAGPGD